MVVYSVLEDSGLTSLHVHHSSEGSYSNSYWNLLLPFIPVLAVKGECEELSESSQTPKGLRTTNTDRYPLWATRTSLEVISMQTFKTVCNPQWWEREGVGIVRVSSLPKFKTQLKTHLFIQCYWNVYVCWLASCDCNQFDPRFVELVSLLLSLVV